MNAPAKITTDFRDSSGFAVFSEGDEGAAHVMAHRLLDEGRHAEGHRLLGEWLARHDGSGSDWVHLHWHMAVFEIAVGQTRSALRRFHERILPAVASGDALTDAPSLLWRLFLAAGPSLELDWTAVRAAAVARLHRTGNGYVGLHHLLALSGAGDVAGLDRWLEAEANREPSSRGRLLARFARGFRALAAGDGLLAAALLPEAGEVAELGGSRAQNELFGDIRQTALRSTFFATGLAA